jgi:hypothetical protein
LGVFARSVVVNVNPYLLIIIYLPSIYIIGCCSAAFHVMVCDEFPAHVIPVVFVMLLQMALRWHLL